MKMNEMGEFVDDDDMDPSPYGTGKASGDRSSQPPKPGVFDQITDVSLAQIHELMHASKEDLPVIIEKSKAVSQLLTNLNNNMGNAVKVAGIMAAEGADVDGLRATMPRMLGGR
jgi:hypothetical protein